MSACRSNVKMAPPPGDSGAAQYGVAALAFWHASTLEDEKINPVTTTFGNGIAVMTTATNHMKLTPYHMLTKYGFLQSEISRMVVMFILSLQQIKYATVTSIVQLTIFAEQNTSPARASTLSRANNSMVCYEECSPSDELQGSDQLPQLQWPKMNCKSDTSNYDSPCDSSAIPPTRLDKTIEFNNMPLQRCKLPSRKRQQPHHLANDASTSCKPTQSHHSHQCQSKRVTRSNSNDGECKVLDYHVDFSHLQCIVKLPANAVPGQQFFVKWPTDSPVLGSKLYMFECPRSAEHIPAGAQRLMKVVAPGGSFDPLQEATSALLRVPFLSQNSKKSQHQTSVRVGQQYQASIVPLAQDLSKHGLDSNRTPL